MNRRQFLLTTTLAATSGLTARSEPAPNHRRFTIDLTPGAIGVSGELPEIIRLAHTHGFESVQPDTGYLARQDDAGIARTKAALAEAGLKWGAAGLPVEFRRDDTTFRRDLERLAPVAQALKKAEVTRIGTWLSPASGELPYDENLQRHVTRLRETARLLADHGLRLGLEYVGTPSLRARAKHEFVHKLAQARELIAEINVPGVGLVLDSWHWWTAGDSVADLRQLRNEDVIAVDLNDAPAGVALAEQQDNRRELPVATGVIPVKDFLAALVAIGYDGPIRAEPFNQPLNALDNEAACARTAEAMKKAMALVG